MAEPISTLYVDFRAGVAQFDKDLKGIGRSVSFLGKDLSTLGSTLSKTITLPLLVMGGVAVKAFSDVQNAQRTLRVETGKTGDDFKALGDDFKAVFAGVPASADEVALAVGKLSTSTGLTGVALQTLSTTALQLANITKSDLNTVVSESGRLFDAWGVSTNDQVDVLDQFYRASQSSGVGVTELMSAVRGADEVFQPFGFSIAQSTALLGTLYKSGVDVQTSMAGLDKALSNMQKAGITDTAGGLQALIDKIKNAATDSVAGKIALEAFGKAAGKDLADAIRGGKFEVDAMLNTIVNGKDTIARTSEETMTFAESMKTLKNEVTLFLAPVGQALVDALKGSMGDAIKGTIKDVADLVEKFAQLSPEVQRTSIQTLAFAAAMGPFVNFLGLMVQGAGAAIDVFRKLAVSIGLSATATTLLAGALPAIKAFFSAIALGLTETVAGMISLPGAIAAAAPIVTGALAGIASGFAAMFGSITLAAAAAGGDFRLFLDGVVELFTEAGPKLADRFLLGLNMISEGAQSFFSSYLAAQTTWAVQVSGVIKQYIGIDLIAIWEATWNKATEIFEKFRSAIIGKLDDIIANFRKWQTDFKNGIGVIGEYLGVEAWVAYAAGATKAQYDIEKGMKGVSKETLAFQLDLEEGTYAVSKGFRDVAMTTKAAAAALAAAKARGTDISNMFKETKEKADEAAKAIKALSDNMAEFKAQIAENKIKKQIEEMLKVGTAADLEPLFKRMEDGIAESSFQGWLAGTKDATPEMIEIAKKHFKERAQLELQIYREDVLEKKVELDKAAHKESVDFFRGQLEDMLSGTRFSFKDQFKKIAVDFGAEFLSALTGGVGGFQATFQKILTDLAGGFAKLLTTGVGGVDLLASLAPALEAAGPIALLLYLAPEAEKRIKELKQGIFNFKDAISFFGSALGSQNPIANLLSGSQGDDEAISRKSFEKYLEDKIAEMRAAGHALQIFNEEGSLVDFGENFIFGDRGRFEGDWATDFWNEFGDAGGATFQALGTAFEQILGLESGLGGQIGAVLAENLATGDTFQNLDNIKLFLDGIGVSAEDLTKAIFEMAAAGKISWLEFESFRQSLAQIPAEGLAAAGNYAGAMQIVLDSGGRGINAIRGLQDLAIEAGEAGITSLDGLRTALVAAGLKVEDVNILFQALGQRGITSIDELKGASEEQLGGVIADMEALGIVWTENAEGVDGVSDSMEGLDESTSAAIEKVNELAEALDALPTDRTINVHVNQDDDVQPTARGKAFASGDVFRSRTFFRFGGHRLGMMGEAGPEAVMPLTRINGKLGVAATGMGGGGGTVFNIDARGAAPGVEVRILTAMQQMEDRVVLRAVRAARA